MKEFVNTVMGKRSVKTLGVTLMHEHILQANWSMRQAYPEHFNYEEFLAYASEDVKRTKEIGVSTIVEQTPICLGRDVHAMRDVAQMTGMNVIASTGFFHTENQFLFGRTMESILSYLQKDIEEGMQGTDIRPGLIKCATDKEGVTMINETLLHAHAIAAKESGLPIGTHAYVKNRSGISQMDVFEKYDLNPKKIVIGHCGDTNDIGYLKELLRRGCYIGLDRFGDDEKNPLKQRIKTLTTLCELGFISQLMISHDYASFVDLGKFSWDQIKKQDPDDVIYNARYIHRYVLPVLSEAGFPEADIHTLLVENPRRFFEEE